MQYQNVVWERWIFFAATDLLFCIFNRCLSCCHALYNLFLSSQKLTIALTFPVTEHFTYLRNKGKSLLLLPYGSQGIIFP